MPARGVSFQFVRKYRSAQHQDIGSLGRGWTFTYTKRIEQDGSDILYHDGFWRIHRFAFSSAERSFLSPDGFYALVTAEQDRFLLRQRLGDLFVFEHPVSGGRLLAIEDRNGNALRFEYQDNHILVTDPFERQIEIALEQNRVVELRDHTHRNWQYVYDDNECLVEVIQPPIHGLPDRPVVQYTYDQDLRLTSITDPKGQTFLRNFYDEQGRITTQHHGDGTFEFDYEPINKADMGFASYRTKVKVKNGGLLSLKHDQFGHVVERTLHVSASALMPGDRNGVSEGTVPLTTRSSYNRHGELIQRADPAGNSTEWVYDQDNTDPRAQGNLLQVTQVPVQGSGNDVLPLTTRYTYEPLYQQLASVMDARGHTTAFEYDSRGNLSQKVYPDVTVQEISSDANTRGVRQVRLIDRFEYNEAGQLIRFTDPRGASIEYFYYPTSDPTGASSPSTSQTLVQTAGGFLARIVRDPASEDRRLKDLPANLSCGFRYDAVGNVTTILDGKDNPTYLEYDAQHNLVRATSRQPFNYTTSFRYDANGNMIEGTLSFDHHEYDAATQEVVTKATAVRQGFEYNRLNNILRRTVEAGDGEKVTSFIRDAAENIVREIQPLGNVRKYDFDERNQMVARRIGVGSDDEIKISHTYTANGRLSSTTNGRGHTTSYNYDSFHRYEGFTNAGGTAKQQWLDQAGNVTRIQVLGELVTFNESSEPVTTQAQSLLESWFQYDELNRLVRMDRAWRDPLTGEALGRSQYDAQDSVVSSVVEYGDNHLPAKLWTETGNIVHVQYDGAGRVSSISDETGETVSIEYDDNSNPLRIERLGPPANEGEPRFHQIIKQQFDELDRLIARSVNEDNREAFSYNALGALMEYQDPAGASVRALHDAFGRLSGGMTTATTAESVIGRHTEQTLLQRVEWDDNNRMIASVNARGNATRYQYDALNRLSGLVFADGATKGFERDGAGNITRVIDPNHTMITNRFDDLNRLVERQVENADGAGGQVETFHYDGLNRLVAALTPGATTLRRYDSRSHLLEETQSGHTVHYGYDSAGNRGFMRYPGGQEVHISYDLLGRVVEVRGQDGLIAAYKYASGTQFRQQRLGDVLKATYTYEPGKDWLSSLVYRSVQTDQIVEGSKYRYDAAGNRIQEVQLRRGEDVGERYFYDSANRLVKVQYGVERLSDPDSPFEREVVYELSPTGIWQRKTTRDANGQTLEQAEGVANQRERYLYLGNRRFEYDANGNRIREEDGANRDEATKRYSYDHANRLMRVERVTADGQVVQTVEYSYDTFGRQVLKRITQDGTTSELARIWNGTQLAEEWEDGRLAKSFVYGGRIHEPLTMTLYSGEGKEEYFYAFNGAGSVTALIGQNAHVFEGYHYDVYGQPFLSTQSGQTVSNPLLTGAQLYDSHTRFSVLSSVSYDATTAQTANTASNADLVEPPGPYVGTFSEVPILMTPDPRIPPVGGKSEYIPPIESEDYPASIGAHAAIAGIIIITGLELGVGAITARLGIGGRGGWHAPKFWGGVHLGWEAFWEFVGHGGGHPGGSQGYGGSSPGGSQGYGGSSPGGSQGYGGSSPGGSSQDRPFGGGVDYGHAGGGSGSGGGTGAGGGTSGNGGSGTASGSGSGGTSGGGSGSTNSSNTNSGGGQKEHKPVLDNNGNWVWGDTGQPVTDQEKKDAGAGKGGQMPNPEDGTGEGIDKDWWRGLLGKGPLEAFKSPLKIDEREQTPYLSLGSLEGTGYLIVPPQLITVDERGEHLTLNLQGVHSTSRSGGTTTSDGWGDKPRSWAEAVAAPRIRNASISRF
ncbi:MAG: DUF6531 domain-containing protein [Pseudomonadota bacterium]|nr:DUF6531 domain-containing protein [Pseudomonadota bacterium]